MRTSGVSTAAFGSVLAAVAVVALFGPRATDAQVAAASPSPCPTMWCVTRLAAGVTWMRRTMALPSGVPQVNVVDVDPAFATVRATETKFAPALYETVPAMANDLPVAPALVAVNGGYFQNNPPPPPMNRFGFNSMLKLGGTLVAPPPVTAPALGMSGGGFAFAVEPGSPDPLADYPDVVSAGPFVVMPRPVPSAGVPTPAPGPTPFFMAQGFACSYHPRTAAWLRANGHLMLGTFDGTNDSSGLWLDTPTSPVCSGSTAPWNGISLGQFILQNFPDTVQAMNLDGGGSTTFVVNGVLTNVPANNSSGDPRPVIDGLLVVPYGEPPRR